MTEALFYIFNYDFETAYRKMRDGLFNRLRAFEIDLSVEMPYHETLTVFWLRMIKDFAGSSAGDSLVAVRNELLEKFDKDHPLKFYAANDFIRTKRERCSSKPICKYLEDRQQQYLI